MRLPFSGTYPTTQRWDDPCCRASYAKFGMVGHNGIDYNLPCGTPIVAPISGTVRSGFDAGGYGNYIFISDGKLETVVAHLSKIEKASGTVTEGQRIGLSGTTGNSSGCHLHFGVRPIPANNNNGFLGYVDPLPYLKKGSDMFTAEQIKNLADAGGIPQTQQQLNDGATKPAYEVALNFIRTVQADANRWHYKHDQLLKQSGGTVLSPGTYKVE